MTAARKIIATRFFGAVLAVVLLAKFDLTPSAYAGENMLLNPDLSAGAKMPDHWRASRRDTCESFEWFHSKDPPGELRIVDAAGESIFWLQSLTGSQPSGWYHLSVDVRTEGEGRAFLALKSGDASVRADWKATDWQREGFYVRVGANDTLQVMCGLVSHASTSSAFFRSPSLEKISGAPPPTSQQLALDTPPQARFSSSRTTSWILLSVVALVVGFLYSRFSRTAGYAYPPKAAAAVTDSMSAQHGAWPLAGVVIAFGLLLLLTLALTRLEWNPQAGFSVVEPAAQLSDEPHYIITINSMLFDHSLDVRHEYEDGARGGLGAGLRFQNKYLDHQTILVNERTGQHAFASIDVPDSAVPCDPAFPPKDVYEVSVHPLAFPALVALAIAPFQPDMGEVEGDASIVLAVIAWLGMLVTYLVARSLGMGRGKAMLPTLLLALASPWLAYSRSFFPESTIGLVLILVLWAYLADRMALAGFGAAFAAILKPPFAVVGIGFIINEILAGRRRNALKLFLVLAPPGVLLMAFNYWLARTPIISSNGTALPFDLVHLYETFLDSRNGLIIFAPWTLIAFAAIPYSLRGVDPASKALRAMAGPLALYLVLITCNRPALGYGPRYWIAFMPWLALATILALERASRPLLVACAMLAVIGVAIAIPGALRYAEMFSQPPWAAWK